MWPLGSYITVYLRYARAACLVKVRYLTTGGTSIEKESANVAHYDDDGDNSSVKRRCLRQHGVTEVLKANERVSGTCSEALTHTRRKHERCSARTAANDSSTNQCGVNKARR